MRQANFSWGGKAVEHFRIDPDASCERIHDGPDPGYVPGDFRAERVRFVGLSVRFRIGHTDGSCLSKYCRKKTGSAPR